MAQSTQTANLPKSSEIKALDKYQAELGGTGTALLLDCYCGAKYLCTDGGERRLVSTARCAGLAWVTGWVAGLC